LTLQRLQNRVLRVVGNLDRFTTVREMYVVFKIPHVYDHVIELCRTQAEVILNLVNPNIHGVGHGEAMHRNYKRLKLVCCQAYDRSVD
jgi:hypothetical protein